MLNLHKIVRAVITSVAPDENVEVYHSKGHLNNKGALTPVYAEPVTMAAQIQTESGRELFYAGAGQLGQTKIIRKMYLYANSQIDKTAPILRPYARGGDLIFRPLENTWWLVTDLLEDFSNVGWVCVRCTQSNLPAEYTPVIGEGI